MLDEIERTHDNSVYEEFLMLCQMAELPDTGCSICNAAYLFLLSRERSERSMDAPLRRFFLTQKGITLAKIFKDLLGVGNSISNHERGRECCIINIAEPV